jgi:hypothetical protein
MFIYSCLHLNQYHQFLLNIPSQNGVTHVYVSSTTFIFNYYNLMDNLHSYITKVHATIATYYFYVSTPLGSIFMDLVLLFKWLESEFNGMFHHLLAFLKEYVPFSTTSIVVSTISYVHMTLLLIVRTWFNYGVDILVFDFKIRDVFFLFVVCRSNMLFHHLWDTI